MYSYHHYCFIYLRSVQPKREESREAIRKASSDGIRILGQQTKRVLPQAVVDEALIISDLFDLNEIVALELLLMG